jgi:DNA-binding MarR family transcriptional regulator
MHERYRMPRSEAPSITARIEPLPTGSHAPDFAMIELFFFAYRDFVGEADRMLEKHGFGRAHHRVLHFVNRRPGLSVAELLEILEITKQSLARVLKDLVQAGFVEQRAGEEDRRQRLLFLTARGRELADALAGLQGRRVAQALKATGQEHRAVIARFLATLIDQTRGDSFVEGVIQDHQDEVV